jgi:predicted O-methyltransferase YrrM
VYLDFIKYYFKAQNAHGIHSPFVFDFYNNVFKSKENSDKIDKIERLREKNLSNTEKIEIQDFGAGSRFFKSNKRSVASITKSSSKPLKWATLIAKITKHYNYNKVIELGTSVGFTTAYISQINQNATIYTFEGCPNINSLAKATHHELGISNVNYYEGNINETLPKLLSEIEHVDLVFFDANHQYEPTIQYFEWCLTRAHEKSCFVFDDIYWSEGMKKAWKQIKSHPQVRISLDFFFVGLVFFDPKLSKQDFTLK